VYSEGLVVRLSNVTGTSKVSVGDDLAEVVGAVKYEEQAPDDRSGVRLGAEAASDPKFLPRYSVEPWLRNKDSLPIGSQVVVTEKIHGCNFRAGVKNGKLHVGSHFVFQKDPRTSRVFSRLKSFVKKYAPRGWFLKFTEVAPTSVFWKVAIDNDLETKLKAYDGWGLYGEVYGKVQDLKYSVSENDQVKLVIFDVRKPDGNFLSMLAAREFTENLGLQFVPILHVGGLTEKVLELRNGTSELDGATMREGIVIRPILEESGSRRILLKYVGENYKLRKDGTERH
jgi:RNA ligase (TIGR02306 family)